MKRVGIILLGIAMVLSAASCHRDGKSGGKKEVKIYDPYKDVPGRVVKTRYPDSDVPCDVYVYKVDSNGNRTDELLCHAGYHKNGSLYAEKKYQNGIAEGVWNAYYDDGTLWSTETFRNGLQVGEEKTFYENGKLRTHSMYDNGVQVGEEKIYFESGNLQCVRHYEAGVLSGDYKELYEDGKTAVTGKFVNGVCAGEWVRYDNQGHVTGKFTADESTVVCGTCPKCAAIRRASIKH